MAPLPPTLSRAAPHRARREAPASGWTCFAARRARRRAPNDRNRRATRTASWCVAGGTSRLRVGTPSNVTCALQRALSKRSSPSLPLPSQVKPEHVREYRANAPLYVNEEAERADRWDAFLSRGEDGSVATPEKSARAASPSASASADVWGRHTLNAVEAILEGRAPGRSRPDAPRRELELQALVHGGVPMALRGEMWQLFAGVQHRRRPGLYRALVLASGETLPEDAVADDETNEETDDAATEEDVPEADERVAAGDLGPDPDPGPDPVPTSSPARALDEPRTPSPPRARSPLAPPIVSTSPSTSACLPTSSPVDEVAFSRAREQISKDLPRTFPAHPLLDGVGRDALRRVLCAYARHNPSVGYCQGMNFIAALLLLLMEEEAAFWVLSSVCEDVVPGYFTNSMLASAVDQAVLQRLVEEKFPRVDAALRRGGAPIAAVAGSWFLTLYVNHLPWESALRVWDVLLFERTRAVLFQTALALVETNHKRLADAAEEDLVVEAAVEMAPGAFDGSALLAVAVAGFPDVTWDRIMHEYRACHRRMTREGGARGRRVWRSFASSPGRQGAACGRAWGAVAPLPRETGVPTTPWGSRGGSDAEGSVEGGEEGSVEGGEEGSVEGGWFEGGSWDADEDANEDANANAKIDAVSLPDASSSAAAFEAWCSPATTARKSRARVFRRRGGFDARRRSSSSSQTSPSSRAGMSVSPRDEPSGDAASDERRVDATATGDAPSAAAVPTRPASSPPRARKKPSYLQRLFGVSSASASPPRAEASPEEPGTPPETPESSAAATLCAPVGGGSGGLARLERSLTGASPGSRDEMVASLTRRLADADAEVDALRRQLAAAVAQIEAREELVRAREAQLASAARMAAAQCEELGERERAVSRLSAEAARRDARAKALEEENEKMKQTCEEMRVRLVAVAEAANGGGGYAIDREGRGCGG